MFSEPTTLARSTFEHIHLNPARSGNCDSPERAELMAAAQVCGWAYSNPIPAIGTAAGRNIAARFLSRPGLGAKIPINSCLRATASRPSQPRSRRLRRPARRLGVEALTFAVHQETRRASRRDTCAADDGTKPASVRIGSRRRIAKRPSRRSICSPCCTTPSVSRCRSHDGKNSYRWRADLDLTIIEDGCQHIPVRRFLRWQLSFLSGALSWTVSPSALRRA